MINIKHKYNMSALMNMISSSDGFKYSLHVGLSLSKYETFNFKF